MRTSLVACLGEVSQSLERHGLAGAAWPFRDTVDLLTVFLAAAAIAPLSPGEAPLPGWRRGLWKSDFADTAPGLLNWAAAYLPKRSRQNRLASHLLEFLFEDGAAHLASKPRPYTALFGLGDPSLLGGGGWLDWRESFFSRDDPEGLDEAAQGLAPHLETLTDLLPTLDDFLAPLVFGTLLRGDGVRLTLGIMDESEELYPFLLVRDCEVCERRSSVFLLAAPSPGERFIYREVGTGHVVPVVTDQAFQRRFIAGGAPTGRASTSQPRHPGLERLVERSERIRTVTVAEAEAAVAAALTPEVLDRHHRSVLMILCEAGEAVPLELLADPALGCRDGLAAAGRLIGLVVFWENGAAEPATSAVAREMRRLHPAEAKDASRRLALWAEARLQQVGGAGAIGGLAGRGLARWTLASGDDDLRARLVRDDAVGAELLRFLAEEERAGRRSVALQVSDDWLRLLSDASAPLRVARLRAFRGTVRRRAGQFAAARDEFDRALALVPAAPGSYEFRAQVLTDRARTHLDLRQPASAAEDGAQAAEAWRRVASANPAHPEVMLAQLELTSLRGRALVQLGQPRQAASLMQKVADSLAPPRRPAEVTARLEVEATLAELLRGLGDSASSETRYRQVLDLLDRAPEGRDLRETRALALRGAASSRDPEAACQDLQQARVLLEELLNGEGRLDLKPVLACVLDDLAGYRERVGLLAESRQSAQAAGTLYGELLAGQERLEWRTAWARLLRRQARVARALEAADQAEEDLARALDLYRRAGEGVAERFRAEEIEILADRGMLRISQERWEEALADLDESIQCAESPGKTALPVGVLSRCHLERARIHWRHGRAEEAVRDFDRALDLRPDKSDRTLLVEIARDRSGALLASGHPERAEEDLTTLLGAVSEPVEQAALFASRGVARLRTGRLAEALQDLEAAAQDPPQALRALASQGLAHLRLGHKQQATRCFQDVLEQTRDLPAGPTRVENVLAHGGLAILRESVGGMEHARADWAAAARAWVPEGAAPGLLSWEVGEILTRSGEVCLAHGDPEAALADLLQAVELQRKPALRAQAGLVRLRLHGALSRALAELGREREAVAQARSALEVPESVALQDLDLASSLHLYCSHVLVSAGACGDAARLHAEQAAALMQRRLDERWDAGVQGDLALALLLRGTVRLGLGQLEEAWQDQARAVQLNEDLRGRMDGHGLEWELALALVRRAEVDLSRARVVEARSDLVAVSGLLVNAPAPRPGHGWVRLQLLETLAGLLVSGHGVSVGRVLGELTGLPVWSWAEGSRLEEAWREAVDPLLTEESLPSLACAARSLGGFSTPPDQSAGGTRLLEAWVQRALALVEAASPQAETALRTLVEVSSAGSWDPELTCRALHGLARLWESQGRPEQALELLDEAERALVAKEPVPPLRAASILVCRARLRAHLGQRELALEALDQVEAMPEVDLPAAMQSEIVRLRGVLTGTVPASPGWTEPGASPGEPAPSGQGPGRATRAPSGRGVPAAPVAGGGAGFAGSPSAPGAPSGEIQAEDPDEPDFDGEEVEAGPAPQDGLADWDSALGFEQVDTALDLLDSGDLPEAERLLLEAGHDLPSPGGPQDLVVLEMLPGLLEGLQGVVEGMLSKGWLPRALAVAEYGSSLANQHLAEAFDSEAWPWWGDLELLLGRLHRQMGHLDTAAIYFRRAREIHAAVAGQGVSDEAWRDAFRAAVTGAGTWQDQGAADEAELEYSEAVELGIQALAANLPEEVTLARVYMGRARLRIQAGNLPEAMPDYECAMELYQRAYEAGRADLLAELGASRIGLAEVCYRLDGVEEGEAMRLAAIEAMDDLRARGDEEEARGIGQMLIALEEFRPRD